MALIIFDTNSRVRFHDPIIAAQPRKNTSAPGRARAAARTLFDMKTSLHASLATLFLLLALAGCSRQPDNPPYHNLLRAQADAAEARILLTELRDGRVTNALELLETQMDTAIIQIDQSLAKVPGPERDTALAILQLLKEYRTTHPRQQEAVLREVTKEDAEELARGTQAASRILSDLK